MDTLNFVISMLKKLSSFALFFSFFCFPKAVLGARKLFTDAMASRIFQSLKSKFNDTYFCPIEISDNDGDKPLHIASDQNKEDFCSITKELKHLFYNTKVTKTNFSHFVTDQACPILNRMMTRDSESVLKILQEGKFFYNDLYYVKKLFRTEIITQMMLDFLPKIAPQLLHGFSDTIKQAPLDTQAALFFKNLKIDKICIRQWYPKDTIGLQKNEAAWCEKYILESEQKREERIVAGEKTDTIDANIKRAKDRLLCLSQQHEEGAVPSDDDGILSLKRALLEGDSSIIVRVFGVSDIMRLNYPIPNCVPTDIVLLQESDFPIEPLFKINWKTNSIDVYLELFRHISLRREVISEIFKRNQPSNSDYFVWKHPCCVIPPVRRYLNEAGQPVVDEILPDHDLSYCDDPDVKSNDPNAKKASYFFRRSRDFLDFLLSDRGKKFFLGENLQLNIEFDDCKNIIEQ